jgi:GT2 family glycosyltransferase
MAPLVSVIIPAYKVAQYIAATLDSVLAQTFKEYEIIVVNDGSPDTEELEKVLAPYRDRITYLRQENQGQSAARNTGIRAARGKYIAPLDGDDMWDPEYLAAQLAVLEADPSLDMIYADARVFGEAPEAGRTLMELSPSTGEVTFERLVTRQCAVNFSVSVCRRETLLRAGLFDPAQRRVEDIDLWLRIARQGGRIVYQRRVLGSYRRHAGNLSANQVADLEAFLSVLAKAARDPSLTAAQRETIERQSEVERTTLELQKGKRAFLEGDDAAAISHLSRANAQRNSLKLALVVTLLKVAPAFLRVLYQWRDRSFYKLKIHAAPNRASRVMVLFACLSQLLLGNILALTRIPICDEGYYGVPAHVLSLTGALRNPVLESAGINDLRGVDRRLYWMAPMGMVLQAGAFHVFGFGLLVQRELSIVCGLGALLLWYLALKHLVADRVAALAIVILSADLVFNGLSSLGRTDIISIFFAMAALAGYMHWRERSLALALAVANTACALSGMVHPNGGIAAVVSLVVLTLYLDRARLRWSHLCVAAACYGVLGLGWGLYIARDPDLFKAQFLGNVADRFAGPMALSRLIKGEATRYVSAWGLENARGVKLVRYLFPASYLSAILFCVLSKDLRRRSRVLLLMFVAISLSLVFGEGSKQGWYLVHLTPLFAVFLAISANSLWESGNIPLRMVAAAQAAIVLLGVASLAYTVSNRNLQRRYRPIATFLNAHLEPRDLVMAGSEFYYGLQCRACLRDDENLGAFSGRRASYIVLSSDYGAHLVHLRDTSPAIYRGIAERLRMEYREVFRNSNYRILRKTTAGSEKNALKPYVGQTIAFCGLPPS